jgi:hypothetical protein
MQLRGFEMHSSRMWDGASVRRVVDFMIEAGMNALVFHQVDIIDHLVAPEEYFGRASLTGKWPAAAIFGLQHRQENNCAYINQVTEYVHSKKIKFFLEVKEPRYPEQLLYVRPNLLGKEGQVCPTNPFWWEYLRTKVATLLDNIPDLDGIIESAGTMENKVSFTSSSCTCERCRKTSFSEWNNDVISSIYEPLKAKGKQFIIRDFTYLPSVQEAMFDLVEKIPREVIICLKYAPHDFYPTFPNNPRIGAVGEHDQWVEFDAWGEFFGFGIFPCIILDDIKERLRYAMEKGVKGFICRTDWEAITEGWVLDSLNLINLYGLAKLSLDLEYKYEDIFKDSLEILFHNNLPFLGKGIKVESEEELGKVISLLLKTWPIIKGTLFSKDFILQDDSRFFDSVEKARHVRNERHPLAPWAPGRKDPINNLSKKNLEQLLNEKEEAWREITTIVKTLKEDGLNLDRRLNICLLSLFEAFEVYIEGFYYSGKAYILTEYALNTKNAEDIENAIRSANLLPEIGKKLEKYARRCLYEPYSHVIYMLLDHRRLLQLHRSLLNELDLASTS